MGLTWEKGRVCPAADIRLLAVDMDGTCLDGRSQITDRTMRALRAAARSGILVVPTTGRALCCLPHRLAGEKELYRYVISSNGAEVTDTRSGSSVFRAEIPEETALRLLRECGGEGLGVTAHIRRSYLLEGRLLALLGRLIYGRDAKQAKCVKNMEKTIRRAARDVEELQLYFLKHGAGERIRQILEGYPQLAAAYTKTYVEIVTQEATKGTALAALAARLRISAENIACIGDGENDLTMFRVSGLRLAMGNAVPSLKAAADYVLPSNRDDGAAEGIEKFVIKTKDA